MPQDNPTGPKGRKPLFKGLASCRNRRVFPRHFCPSIPVHISSLQKRNSGDFYPLPWPSIAPPDTDEVERHAPEIRVQAAPGALLQEIIAGANDQGCYEESLKSLTRFLHEQHNARPVILIDEYDTPIHAAWQSAITRT